MNAGLTESQEDLLDKVARPSKRLWLRRMLVAANQSESDREIRRIEKLLAAEFGAVRGDIGEIKQNTQDVPWLSKFVGNLFKYGAGAAEKKYPSRKSKV